MLGFVTFPVLAKDTRGVIISLEAEAYVVPSMHVPILLGEDFQLSYDIGIQRSAEKGSSWTVNGHTIRATSLKSRAPNTHAAIASSKEYQAALMAYAFAPPRVKASKRALRDKYKESKRLKSIQVRLATSVLIPPKTVSKVPIVGNFKGRLDWMIERVMLSESDGSFLGVEVVGYTVTIL